MPNAEFLARLDDYIASIRCDFVNDWKALVAIPSVSKPNEEGYPFGPDCARVLEKAISLSQEHGFRAENHDNWYGTAEYGAGEKQIGIFAHLDVVEAGEGWIYSPFEPVEKDGFLIGRGAGDNKSAAVLGLYVMKAFRDLSIPLNSRLLLYFGTNEEKGMKDIERFIREQPMPDCSLVPDLFFPVCHGEKGGLKIWTQSKEPLHQLSGFSAGEAENMVPDQASVSIANSEAHLEAMMTLAESCEGIAVCVENGSITVTAEGKSGMCSMPENAVNAAGLLAKQLSQLGTLPEQDRKLMEGLAVLAGGHYGEEMGIADEDEASGKLTCVCTLVRCENGCLRLCMNIRYPISTDGQAILRAFADKAGQLGFDVTSVEDNPPLYFEADHPYVEFLCGIYRDITGTEKQAYTIGGGTYARKLKHAVAFGSGNGAKCPFVPEGHGGVHQPDEARQIDAILEAVKVYVAAIYELDGLSREQWSNLWT